MKNIPPKPISKTSEKTALTTIKCASDEDTESARLRQTLSSDLHVTSLNRAQIERLKFIKNCSLHTKLMCDIKYIRVYQ
jgi:hypothetical protein